MNRTGLRLLTNGRFLAGRNLDVGSAGIIAPDIPARSELDRVAGVVG